MLWSLVGSGFDVFVLTPTVFDDDDFLCWILDHSDRDFFCRTCNSVSGGHVYAMRFEMINYLI